MGIPFPVRRKKLGYLITVFVPFGWLFMLMGLKRVRKGIVLGLALYALSIPANIISEVTFDSSEIMMALGFIIVVIFIVAHFWIWWHFYSKWVEEWKLKN